MEILEVRYVAVWIKKNLNKSSTNMASHTKLVEFNKF